MRKFQYQILSILLSCLISANASTAANSYRTFYIHGKKSSVPVTSINNSEYSSVEEIARKVFPGSDYDNSKFEITCKNGIIRFSPSSFFIAFKNPNGMKVAQMNLPAIIYQNKLQVPVNSFLQSLEILEIFSVSQSSGHYKLNRFSLAKKQKTEIKESPKTVTTTAQKESKATKNKSKAAVKIKATEAEEAKVELAAEKQIDTEKFQSDEPIENETEHTNSFKKSIIQSRPAISSGLKSLGDLPEKSSAIEEESNEIKTEVKQYPPNVYVIPPDLKRKELNQ